MADDRQVNRRGNRQASRHENRRDSRIASARDRFARRRRRGRVGRWRVVLGALLLVALVGGGAWLVFWSSVLDVDDVAVEGAQLVSPAAVRQAAGVDTGTPLARVDLDAVAARVEGLTEIDSVRVSRQWPDTLQVEVSERQAVAVVEEAGVYRGLDAEGVLFRDFKTPPGDLPLVRSDDLGAPPSGLDDPADPTDLPGPDHPGDLSDPASRADALREVALVIEALPSAVAHKVDHVEMSSLDSISLMLSDGSQVRWGSAAESDLKADVLATLMSVPATTYDVSVPGLPTTSG